MMRTLMAAMLLVLMAPAWAQDAAWETVAEGSAQRVGIAPTVDRIDAAGAELLLADGLTRQEAVALALARNSTLRAAFAELGVAEADLRQAGLYSNPAIDTIIRWPDRGGRAEVEVEASWDLADLWRVPVRRDLARARLQQVTMVALSETVNTAADARIMWDAARALELAVGEAEAMLVAARELRDHMYERWEYGFGDGLALARMDAEVAQAEVDLEMTRAEAAMARARLRRVAGLPDDVALVLAGELADGPADLPAADELVAHALAVRPDLRAAQLGVDAAQQQLRLEGRGAWQHLALGPAYARETDGGELWGVTVGVDLPIADGNRAQRERARAELGLAGHQLDAAQAMVREEVLVALEALRLAMAREALIREQVLPARERAHEFAQRHAMQMELSMLPVLQTRRELAASRLAHVQARREVAQAQARLELALGGRLPDRAGGS